MNQSLKAIVERCESCNCYGESSDDFADGFSAENARLMPIILELCSEIELLTDMTAEAQRLAINKGLEVERLKKQLEVCHRYHWGDGSISKEQLREALEEIK